MAQEERQANRVRSILREAAEKLDAEKAPLQFFLAVINPESEKMYSVADINGDNMCKMIDCFFEKPEDIRNLAIYVNSILKRRLAEGLMNEPTPPTAVLDPDIQTD